MNKHADRQNDVLYIPPTIFLPKPNSLDILFKVYTWQAHERDNSAVLFSAQNYWATIIFIKM
jgi:hypothetical protein